MHPWVESLPLWRTVCDLIDDRRSILLHAPRHYGKRHIVRAVAQRYATCAGFRFLSLSTLGSIATGGLNYWDLWQSVRKQLQLRKDRKVRAPNEFDKIAFGGALCQLLERRDDCIVVAVDGARRGNEDNHGDVLAVLHTVLKELHNTGGGKLIVVATDDYSLFFHNRSTTRSSDLPYYEKLHFDALSGRNLMTYLEGLARHCDDEPERRNAPNLCGAIEALTGGHAGLVFEGVRFLEQRKWLAEALEAEEFALESHVMASVARELEDDPDGYCRTANEYREPNIPEVNSPRVHYLQELGVLQRLTFGTVRLCPGALTQLVERLSDRRTHGDRVGTVVTEDQMRLFEPGAIPLDDDDFVVIHLSDLHVSDNYAFRLMWPGNSLNPGAPSAAELLLEDLDRMKIRNRVDALVISGDFVWRGVMAEFQRAREIVDELRNHLGLLPRQLLLVPGNHDVEWNPSNFAAAGPGIGVSRENFVAFGELLGVWQQAPQPVVELPSRGKGRTLRFLCLDSNRVEGPEAAGIGFVSRESLNETREALERLPPAQTPTVNIMVVHHHVLPATSADVLQAQSRKVSVMANAAEVLNCANRWNVQLVLHGHEHQPSITVARRWPIDVGVDFCPLAVLGAGSFSVKRDFLGPFSRQQYYVVYLRKDNVVVRSRAMGPTGMNFITHNDMLLPLNAGPRADAVSVRNGELG